MTTFLYGGLLTLGVVLLVVTAVRILVGGIDSVPDRASRPAGATGGTAQRILDERYAAGELSTEEYQHRLRVLEGRSS